MYCKSLNTFRIRDYHPLWSPFPGTFCYTLNFVTLLKKTSGDSKSPPKLFSNQYTLLPPALLSKHLLECLICGIIRLLQICSSAFSHSAYCATSDAVTFLRPASFFIKRSESRTGFGLIPFRSPLLREFQPLKHYP